MPDLDPRALQRLAEKNREKSERSMKDEVEQARKRRGTRKPVREEREPDSRYEGAERLFNEMKRKPRD